MSTDPDQIRNRIEHTRNDLSADVDALTEKVSPGRVVARRVDRTRNAMTNVKDRIMGTTEQATSTVGDTAHSAMATTADKMSMTADRMSNMASSAADTVGSAPHAAVRRTQGNPLAAGLIAFGAGWLVASMLPSSKKEQQLASQAKDRMSEQLQPLAEQAKQVASEMADNMREPAQQAVDSVKSTATDAASTVADEGRSAAGQVTDRAGEAKQNVGQRMP